MVAFDPSPYLTDGRRLVRALLGPAGDRLREARVVQIDARPGRSVTVQYAVRLDGDDHPTSFVVRAAERAVDGLEPLLEDPDGHPVCAFAGFDDPALPGLRRATDPRRVAALLDSLGIATRRDDLTVRLRAHRPLRRAVIEASAPGGRVFVKVVPPRKVEVLHRRHRLLTDAGVPVAPSVGYSPDGIVVLGEITGTTLREAIDDGSALPGIAAVHALLDRFPPEVAELDGPTAPLRRVSEHAELLELVLPESASRVRTLADGLAGSVEARRKESHPPVPVHGDLYEAQIMTANGQVRAFVDVDGIGGGRRIDDDANALAHLSLYDLVSSHDRARELGAVWLRELLESVAHERSTLFAHVSAALFGLSTGSYRVQEANWQRRTIDRLDLAIAWLDAA